MTKTLRLRQQNDGQIFVLSGSTHIGRYGKESSGQWAVPERDQPDIFTQLEATIQVLHGSISRNHAAIYEESGTYYLLDMNSRNGTKVSGEDIGSEPVELQQDDSITLSNALSFNVGFGETSNYALLVGASGDNPGAVENDVNNIKRQLRRRRYIVQTLTGRESTKSRVKQKLDEISYLTTPDSHFFFSFHGHGNDHGVCVSNQVMDPKTLYKKMQNIRGSRAIVIDACNAGLFVNERNRNLIPEGSLVLASCQEGNQAHETVMIDGGGYISRFSRILVEYLETNRSSFNLKDFYTHANRQTAMLIQEPVMVGQSYTIENQASVLMSRVLPAVEE